jgi:hypothetical protein
MSGSKIYAFSFLLFRKIYLILNKKILLPSDYKDSSSQKWEEQFSHFGLEKWQI